MAAGTTSKTSNFEFHSKTETLREIIMSSCTLQEEEEEGAGWGSLLLPERSTLYAFLNILGDRDLGDGEKGNELKLYVKYTGEERSLRWQCQIHRKTLFFLPALDRAFSISWTEPREQEDVEEGKSEGGGGNWTTARKNSWYFTLGPIKGTKDEVLLEGVYTVHMLTSRVPRTPSHVTWHSFPSNGAPAKGKLSQVNMSAIEKSSPSVSFPFQSLLLGFCPA
ncbi:hypothetical protein RUM44_006575 [Polyplax serrata]|uniref:Uncharacterized protein n=1 Tax=Polyplax serrata TaxID=468196 RepID=A0ABR1AIF4_POLSC